MNRTLHTAALAAALFSRAALATEDVAGKAAEKAAPGSLLADNDITSQLLQTTLGLLVVLSVIIAIAWAVKRFGNLRGGVQGQMRIVGGVSLGSRERVVVLQVGEQQLVLGVAPGQIRTLHVLEQPLAAPAESAASGESSFAMRLQSALKGRGRA